MRERRHATYVKLVMARDVRGSVARWCTNEAWNIHVQRHKAEKRPGKDAPATRTYKVGARVAGPCAGDFDHGPIGRVGWFLLVVATD
ncbi:MAG: hypothetical protein SFV15_13600 [Polyangiaceae bacterium]|nr:hypothetical protein [Polyangiaceae bacterium]